MTLPRKPRRTVAEIAAALEASAGNIAATAALLDMSRQGVEARIDGSTLLQKVKDGARKNLADSLEIQAIKAAQGGHIPTVLWMLERLDKDRYSTRREVTGRNAQPVAVDMSKIAETKLDHYAKLLGIKPELGNE